MGTNTILRGLGRAENLKLFVRGESALGLLKSRGKGKAGVEYIVLVYEYIL